MSGHVEDYYAIEFRKSDWDKDVWMHCSEAPHPYSAMDGTRGLSQEVWEVYVAYLNEREVGRPLEERHLFRLIRWETIRTRHVITPTKTKTSEVKNA